MRSLDPLFGPKRQQIPTKQRSDWTNAIQGANQPHPISPVNKKNFSTPMGRAPPLPQLVPPLFGPNWGSRIHQTGDHWLVPMSHVGNFPTQFVYSFLADGEKMLHDRNPNSKESASHRLLLQKDLISSSAFFSSSGQAGQLMDPFVVGFL